MLFSEHGTRVYITVLRAKIYLVWLEISKIRNECVISLIMYTGDKCCLKLS